MLDVEALREDTPGCHGVIHLNNAGAALPPAIVVDTMVNHLGREAEVGGYEAHAEATDRVANVYSSVATLVNSNAARVALVESATAAWDRALAAIAFSDPPAAGDRVLVSSAEYASNVLPLLQLCRATGATLEFIPDGVDGTLDVDALDDMLDERVRIVSISHVPSQNGLINDVVGVGDVLRFHGSSAWYLVDGCQSIGQLDVDMGRIGCDALSATARKFLRGPRGAGFLVMSDRLVEDVEPFPVDLHSATWASDFSYDVIPGGRRFESWEKSYAAVLGMGAAVDYALSLGIPAIRERIDYLAIYLRSRLAGVPGVTVNDRGEDKAGIVTVQVADPQRAVAELRGAGINTSYSPPDYARHDFAAHGINGLVRLSPHVYNTEDELDTTLDHITRLVGRAAG